VINVPLKEVVKIPVTLCSRVKLPDAPVIVFPEILVKPKISLPVNSPNTPVIPVTVPPEIVPLTTIPDEKIPFLRSTQLEILVLLVI